MRPKEVFKDLLSSHTPQFALSNPTVNSIRLIPSTPSLKRNGSCRGPRTSPENMPTGKAVWTE